ncbi:MAG: amidohydrolase [Desulfobacterales bacterium]|nr:amidohydrolase [Desulfobacterales bacterium]
MEIIDVHTHLGDILNPDGGDLIWQKGIKKRIGYDIISHSELQLYKSAPLFSIEKWIYNQFSLLVTKAEIDRNATATLENMISSMDDNGIKASVCMPIPPYLTFSDLKKASEVNSRIIPFTGVDFTRAYDFEEAFRHEVGSGAKGLKLHPIIQKVPLSDKRTFDAVEAFAVHGLPILFHCGKASYYLKEERSVKQNPELGTIDYAQKLVTAFPKVTFIAGHAGMFEYKETISKLSQYKNVMVDTSFQAPSRVKELLTAFGPDRVMYASDWPYGNRKPAIKVIKKVCSGDTALERRLCYENAAELLSL